MCLNPKLEYALVDAGDKYYLIVADLVDTVMARYAISEFSVLSTAKGSLFENLMLKHPFYDRDVPVIL